MKKRWMQMMTGCLIALLMIPAAGCAKVSDVEETTGVSEGTATTASAETGGTVTETAFDPGIEKKNYDAEMNVVCISSGLKEFCFPSEDGSGEMDPVLKERAIRIKDHIGVDLKLVEAGDWITYENKIHRAVLAGDDAYQMVMTHVYQGVPALISNNCLLDLQELPGIHTDAPYWSEKVMDTMSINGKYYLGYNDFMLSVVHVVTFNKDMMSEYQMEAPYGLVREKKWTLDKLISMSSHIYEDLNHNGRDSEDKYGVTGWGWMPLIDLVTSSDIQIARRDESGQCYVAYDEKKEKILSLIDRVGAWYDAESSFFWKSTDQGQGINLIRMDENRSLFGLMQTPDLLTYRGSKVPLGILPYPLYDEQQEEYRALNWNGFIAVPRVVKNQDMVGETIELLAAYAEPVKEGFYHRLLGLKMSEAPDDAEMLDIIWNAQISDIGLVMSNLPGMDNLVYMLPKLCENHSRAYESYLRTNQKSANTALKKFMEKVASLD